MEIRITMNTGNIKPYHTQALEELRQRNEAEEAARREAEQKAEAARRHAEQIARREAEQKAAAARRHAEEIARREDGQKAEAARKEAEQKAEAARREAEQKAEAARRHAEEVARKEAEQKAAAARKEAEQKAEAARREAEKKAEAASLEAAMKAEVVPKGDGAPVRRQFVKFGLNPILPYSIEEAINRLRINISFLGSDVRRIMVVSTEPNEGKSFITLNLWKQMAMAGEPSILVDMDMRKSVMCAKYQLEREDGLELKGTSHYLSGEDSIENMILHTDMKCGDILPNVDNVVNPSMLLESRKFTEMMDYMQQHYRYTFIDVPPLGLVSDGELIGSVCDGAVLNVRAGVTSRSAVRRSIQQLERAGCPLLGIVLNRVGGAGSGYYSKYYGKNKYYYNDKYYSGKEK